MTMVLLVHSFFSCSLNITQEMCVDGPKNTIVIENPRNYAIGKIESI